AARGSVLWYLHADTGVPSGALAALRASTAPWGCFAVALDSHDPRLRCTAFVMNARARLTGSATGDMAIWARRTLVDAIGGWPALAAFEDLAFTDRARAHARFEVLGPPVTTSARRWEARGVTRTMVEMLALRGAYRAGVDPARLARLYEAGARG
ncbi:MAG: glycosyl transferase, partial [Pseudomonadota bacterium]|nr:glycosyl transferase [Pseudomonadota bacterium]